MSTQQMSRGAGTARVARSYRWYTPWLLVAAPVIWVLVFGIGPFVNTIVLSFTDARPLTGGVFTGLANYERLFSDPLFYHAIGTTFTFMVLCVPLLAILPLLVALLMHTTIPGIAFFRTVAYFPVVASVVVVTLMWKWMFNTRGVINEALQFLGWADDPIPFLVDHGKLIGVVVAMTVWKGMGYYAVVYLAALSAVDRQLHEAAALDGATMVQRFFHVTVPGVRNAILLVAAMIAVAAMRTFSEFYVMTGGTGGPGGETMTIVMLVQQVGSGLNGQLGYASAISVVLFFLTVLPLLAIAWMNSRGGKAAA